MQMTKAMANFITVRYRVSNRFSDTLYSILVLKLMDGSVYGVYTQGRRQVCNSGGAGMLLSAYMQTFSLKIQCTARINLKNWGGGAPPPPPPPPCI